MEESADATDPRGIADIGERAVSVVPVERIGCPLKERGVAVGLDVVLSAGSVGDIQRIDQVVDDEQVEVSIAVVVQETGAAAPVRVSDTCGIADICERAVSVVPIEDVAPEVGNVKVHIAVVIVIGTRCALSVVASVAHACGSGDVGKCAVSVVPIEGAGCGCGCPVSAVDEVDIQIAVCICIKERAASTEGFREVVCPRRAVDMRKTDTRFRGRIHELDTSGCERSRCGDEGYDKEASVLIFHGAGPHLSRVGNR